MDKNKMKKILFINFITMATFNMAHPVTPSLINALSMPTYMFGVLYSTMSIAHFVMSPIWGAMSDQKGRKRFLVIGVIGKHALAREWLHRSWASLPQNRTR